MTRRLHLLGRRNANEGEHQGERHADGVASGQTGARELGVDGTALARQDLAGGVEAVEVAGEFLRKLRQTERLPSSCYAPTTSICLLSLMQVKHAIGCAR